MYLITHVTTPAQGAYLGYSLDQNEDSIAVEACYYSGPLPALQSFVDTINLGLLNEGYYSLEFSAIQTASYPDCILEDSMTVWLNFEVELTNSLFNVIEKEPRLICYPNPLTGDQLTIESEKSITNFEVFYGSGQLLRELGNLKSHRITWLVPDTAQGFLILKVVLADGSIHIHKVLRY